MSALSYALDAGGEVASSGADEAFDPSSRVSDAVTKTIFRGPRIVRARTTKIRLFWISL